MKHIAINDITYFIREDQVVDMSIIFVESYYPSIRSHRSKCLNLINDIELMKQVPKPQKIGKFKELWRIDGIKVRKDTEGTLRKLWKIGGVPFAIDNKYWKGGDMYHFAYPYWHSDEDPNKIRFRSDTYKIIDELENIATYNELTDIIKRFVEYERFCIDHRGTLCELFRDYYDKYIRYHDQEDTYPYYAIYYFFVRLGYWYMDYNIDLNEGSKLYISINGNKLYIDENVIGRKYELLDKFFHISLPVNSSPDD